ncbi:MAG: DUF1080 domain-containing protein [Chitinophagaceae bacterium]
MPGQKSEWHTFLSQSKNSDPKNVFHFEGDILHATGEEFGYITTNKKYGDFHFTVEFKWGTKKFPPRENEKRDAGIMYHVDFYNGDKVWPRSLEYQVQEGDCGDFWMTDSTTIIKNDTLTQPKNWFRIAKFNDAEKPNGEWNKAEVIVQNNTIQHLINGVLVNSAKLGNTKEGYILLQSEGAEIFYRNAEVEEL